MAEEILDGINPTRMELLALKDREKLAVKGHSLLKQKRDALIKEFFDILDRVKGARENAETNLSEAYAALTEAQITMGDLAVQKAALSVKESVKVDISSSFILMDLIVAWNLGIIMCSREFTLRLVASISSAKR